MSAQIRVYDFGRVTYELIKYIRINNLHSQRIFIKFVIRGIFVLIAA